MAQEILDRFEEKGMGLPFTVTRDGEASVSKGGLGLKQKITQTGTVIFETINAVGGVKIDSIEIVCKTKGLLIAIEDERIFGTLFEKTEGEQFEDLWDIIKELITQSRVKRPEEKVKTPLSPNVLDAMKVVLKNYLGDFAERIYQNQIKSQRINPEEFFEDDARRLVFALGKAAGMIIGPTKGKELTNKLLEKIK